MTWISRLITNICHDHLDVAVDLELLSSWRHIKSFSSQASSLKPTVPVSLDVKLHSSQAASQVKLTLNLDVNQLLNGNRSVPDMVLKFQSERDLSVR